MSDAVFRWLFIRDAQISDGEFWPGYRGRTNSLFCIFKDKKLQKKDTHTHTGMVPPRMPTHSQKRNQNGQRLLTSQMSHSTDRMSQLPFAPTGQDHLMIVGFVETINYHLFTLCFLCRAAHHLSESKSWL